MNSHILVIDDQPEELHPLLELIRAQGMRLSLATDPYQALQRAQVLHPDLIILDVHMPNMNGFTLCRLLREAPATRQTPVIFLSSAASLEDRLAGLTLGGVDYVLKPCAPEEVLARIRIHLQLSKRSQPEPITALDTPRNPEQVILHAAMRLLAQQLASPPSLVEIARQVGTHDKKLSAIFRQHLGMTVFAYLREERLRKSQELLADSNMSIQGVADLVGFSSAANFTTAFRERTGVTPSAYRNQAQAGSALAV